MTNSVTKEVVNDQTLFVDSMSRPQVYWHDEQPAAENCKVLGEALAMSGDLFRRPGNDGGLFLVLPDGSPRSILNGKQLSSVMTDRIDLNRFLNGKQKASRISVGTLGEMLHSEAFLSPFAPIDRVTSQPEYLPGFTLTNPGYNDGGDGHRCFFVGDSPECSDSMERMSSFRSSEVVSYLRSVPLAPRSCCSYQRPGASNEEEGVIGLSLLHPRDVLLLSGLCPSKVGPDLLTSSSLSDS